MPRYFNHKTGKVAWTDYPETFPDPDNWHLNPPGQPQPADSTVPAPINKK